MDAQVKRHRYPSRSAAIDAALRNQKKTELDADYEAMLAQLDPDEEQALANERYRGEVFG